MMICLCQGVSDRQVRKAALCGANTRQEVTAACGAGAGCGGCHDEIRQIIRKCNSLAAASEKGLESQDGPHRALPTAALA